MSLNRVPPSCLFCEQTKFCRRVGQLARVLDLCTIAFQNANSTRKASPALLELRSIPLHPAHDRCMRKMQSTFGHHLNKVAKPELVTQEPAHTEDDHFPIEMAACKQTSFMLLTLLNCGPLHPNHQCISNQSRHLHQSHCLPALPLAMHCTSGSCTL